MKYFLEIAYKGTNYHGWQIQKNAHSVQQELNQALEKLFQQKIETFGSGRTDTGVHAEQQYVQVTLNKELTEEHVYKLNRVLPHDIAVKGFRRVSEEATARYDAEMRGYEYRITTVKDPFLHGLTWHFNRQLDIAKMNEAASVLLRHQDFQSFSKVNTSVEHFLCAMYLAQWEERGPLLVFRIEANRFLRGMVRAVVGTLVDVGLGKMSISEFEEVILKKDRRAAGQAAPPEGLFLVKVRYPERIFI